MAPRKTNTEDGRKILFYMLSLPLALIIMGSASPHAFHWYHTFWAIVFGAVVWVGIAALGLCHYMDPWGAILLTLEAGFGLVPMVYLIFDMHRVGEACEQKVHQARIMSSVPMVLMAKQLGRTVLDAKSQGEKASTWWHVYVDSAELLTYLIVGFLNAGDVGELFFLIYHGSPVTLSSLLLDHLVLRLSILHRANDRLMQTAFAAVVRVDGLEHSKVLESSSRFDILVDGQASGSELGTFFIASKAHLNKLCSPSMDSERVVRRLRTTLVSMSKTFQQDVELRVLSATEDELQNEKGLLLGVSIMGERLPFNTTHRIDTSCLLEQYLDEVGQLYVGEVGSTEVADSLPELAEVTSFDSVSCAGMRPRRRRQFSHSSMSDTSASDVSNVLSNVRREGQTCGRKVPSTSEMIYPYKHPWVESLPTEYLKECSRSLLMDLVSSWNYAHNNCCHWHANVGRLSKLVEDMARWHSCSDVWPSQTPSWQCCSCSSLQFDHDIDQCWLCYEPGNVEPQ